MCSDICAYLDMRIGALMALKSYFKSLSQNVQNDKEMQEAMRRHASDVCNVLERFESEKKTGGFRYKHGFCDGVRGISKYHENLLYSSKDRGTPTLCPFEGAHEDDTQQ